MSKALEKALYKAAALTFDELGFMLPSPELEEGQKSAAASIAVSVSFQGPVNGMVHITLCGELLPILAANMLGAEGVPSKPQQHDALLEVANVICGNLLPLMAGTTPVFNVGLPQVQKDPTASSKETMVAFSQIGIEEGRAELRLFLDNPKALEEL